MPVDPRDAELYLVLRERIRYPERAVKGMTGEGETRHGRYRVGAQSE